MTAPRQTGATAGRASRGEENMVWTAPGYNGNYGTPANMTLKRKETSVNQGQVQLTNAEINRMANKVYEILEDRISREKRRLGL
jgi:hypothetical protein